MNEKYGMTKEEFACHLGASEVIDCSNPEREGVILGVNGTKLWVEWIESGRRTWISTTNCHNQKDRKSGYFLPALV